MAKTCADCIWFDWKNKQTSSIDRRRCTNRGIYIEPTASTCSYFKEKEKASSSNCFITTVVVDILGYNDDCYILKTLRHFRDNILQKSPEFESVLLTYDRIGPIISHNLQVHPNKQKLSVIISEYYLIPICELIENKEYYKAINLYIQMVRFLQNQVCVQDYIDGFMYDSSVRQEEKGHGRALVISTTN